MWWGRSPRLSCCTPPFAEDCDRGKAQLVSAVQEKSFLDYVYVVLRWRRFIAVTSVVVAVAAAGVSLVLPEKWTARTSLLPPEEEGADRLGLSLVLGSGVPAGLAGLVGMPSPSERLITLLESRRVLGSIVDDFDLIDTYDAPHRDHAIDLLNEHVKKELETDGTLVIKVTAGTPESAADLANALAARLDSVNRQYRRQQARAMRGFLADRLAAVRGEMAAGARSLQAYQEEYGLVDVEAQTQASVELIRSLVQQLTLLEVEFGWRSRQLSADHPERELLELQVQELRQRLQATVGGMAATASSDTDRLQRTAVMPLGPPLRDLPKLMFEYTELTLQLNVTEEIVRFLGAKLEEAKYREALNTPTLQVLDRATPPEARSAPRRVLLVLGCTAASLALSTALAFVFESMAMAAAANRAKVEAIRQLFR